MGVLWNSDGTNSGTGMIDNNVIPIQIITSEDLFYIIDYNFGTEDYQLVSYDGTTSIVDSGVGVENIASVGDTLFYTRVNNLYYHATNHGEYITL